MAWYWKFCSCRIHRSVSQHHQVNNQQLALYSLQFFALRPAEIQNSCWHDCGGLIAINCGLSQVAPRCQNQTPQTHLLLMVLIKHSKNRNITSKLIIFQSTRLIWMQFNSSLYCQPFHYFNSPIGRIEKSAIFNPTCINSNCVWHFILQSVNVCFLFFFCYLNQHL